MPGTDPAKRGRPVAGPGMPAKVILRFLLLKHMRDWSYEELAREVRANFVYRQFNRIGGKRIFSGAQVNGSRDRY
jgi:transposase, IS5 family